MLSLIERYGYQLVFLGVIIFGLVWLVIGIVLLAWLTRGFRQAPPQMKIDEQMEATS
jgi:hypothetical protein